jgi:diaminohydroxyphosphoribosylaminopyrimidine deaminase/5-amino-6-(5-phosphoribosylamino)uracil reductase
LPRALSGVRRLLFVLLCPDFFGAHQLKNSQHIQYMQYALRLAAQGRYNVSPNPMVGCLIVQNSKIVGEGYHQRAGDLHAEIYALQQAGLHAKNATVYLTLEPCTHYGATPPCITALIKAQVKKVYIATHDPNPLVNGNGVYSLQQHGIDVEVGLCELDALELNEIFCHYMKTQQPFIISKWAMSLDGQTCTNAQDSRHISSLESQQHAHKLRQSVDAILVGANTIRHDNPQLTARYSDVPIHRQPTRIILTKSGNLPIESKIFKPNLPGKTIIVSSKKFFSEKDFGANFENLVIPENQQGQIDLIKLLKILAQRRITSILIEGGMQTQQNFISANLINKYHVHLAAKIIANLAQKQSLHFSEVYQLGGDYHFTAIKKANF